MSLLKEYQYPAAVLRKMTGEAFIPNGARSYVVLKDFGLTYGRIPKAANSTIKAALFELLKLEVEDHSSLSRDGFWRQIPDGKADLLTGAQLQKRHPDAFIFSFTRNPFARVSSCYFNKIKLKQVPSSFFRRRGFARGTTFAEFVERIADYDDSSTDKHLMSQSHILSHNGKILPEFVGQVETIDLDWERLTQLVLERGGPRLGLLGHRNKTKLTRPPDTELFADPALVRLVRTRYQQDFEVFYPDLDCPA
ncbi:MAG: sulfotransferase family protein [Aestuariivirgaceae bacterium]